MPKKNKTACRRRKCQRSRSQRRRQNNNRRTRTIRGPLSAAKKAYKKLSIMSGGVFLTDRIKKYTVEKIDRKFFDDELKYWLPPDHFFNTVYKGSLFGDRIPVRVKSITKINDDNTDGENIDNEFIIGKIAIVIVDSSTKTEPQRLQLPIQNAEMNNVLTIVIDNRDGSRGLNKLTFTN